MLKGESAAQFWPGPGAVSRVGYHRPAEEIWYALTGRGETWRRTGGHEEITPLASVFCLAVPRGASFGFRAVAGAEPTAFALATRPMAPAFP
ncbi:MAG: cupin domain-containing protein [Rhodobacteraceae bacterium]|nr:cupin domain-containing protein [Paracoccaceae bacterium]